MVFTSLENLVTKIVGLREIWIIAQKWMTTNKNAKKEERKRKRRKQKKKQSSRSARVLKFGP